ncbi:MAG TPA: NUDIX domain-containing protein [Acidimicrobiales bacterium]|nr:NUDIX domain-containing protein [Acidimicrobiales bacterium]
MAESSEPRGPAWLESYEPAEVEERRSLERVRELFSGEHDPYDRSLPLHLTGSAIVLDPQRRRVLLRWHERQGAWLHVGGHGDPGEDDPLAVALREAEEETGLADLRPLRPAGGLARPVHLAVVAVKARHLEPAHEHADVRYALVTATPERARAESASAPVRWVSLDVAVTEVDENLAATLRRVAELLGE